MKSRYIIAIVIGAAIGMIFAYLSTDSLSAGNLASGALFGGLIGLFVGVSAAVPAGSGRRGGGGLRIRMIEFRENSAERK